MFCVWLDAAIHWIRIKLNLNFITLHIGYHEQCTSVYVPDRFRTGFHFEIDAVAFYNYWYIYNICHYILAEAVRKVSRRISYEEFAEQYTDYKPPKRYEKKQSITAADKVAPKIRIMVSLMCRHAIG